MTASCNCLKKGIAGKVNLQLNKLKQNKKRSKITFREQDKLSGNMEDDYESV